MYDRDGLLVYGARLHKEVIRRAKMIRDRGNNLFAAAEMLDRSLPKDQRFDDLSALLNQYFAGMVVLFELEDEIDDAIVELAQEIGR